MDEGRCWEQLRLRAIRERREDRGAAREGYRKGVRVCVLQAHLGAMIEVN